MANERNRTMLHCDLFSYFLNLLGKSICAPKSTKLPIFSLQHMLYLLDTYSIHSDCKICISQILNFCFVKTKQNFLYHYYMLWLVARLASGAYCQNWRNLGLIDNNNHLFASNFMLESGSIYKATHTFSSYPILWGFWSQDYRFGNNYHVCQVYLQFVLQTITVCCAANW